MGNRTTVKTKAYIALTALSITVVTILYSSHEPVKTHAGPLSSQLPMMIFKDKTVLYQVVTDENIALTALVIQLKPKSHQAFHKVYLNYRSQFVYNDGSPILFKGEPIFWNNKGNIVNYNYKVIHEGSLFYINERAMTLLEFQSISKVKYHNSLRDNVRLENLKVLKNDAK
jgi:hypothetical protein